jgi:hypothetical protein
MKMYILSPIYIDDATTNQANTKNKQAQIDKKLLGHAAKQPQKANDYYLLHSMKM